MADAPVRTTTKQAMQIAALIVGALLTFNTAFFFLSNLYYAGDTEPFDIVRVRLAFGMLTLIVGAASFTAALAPRVIGHAVAFVLGLMSLVAGGFAIAHDLPPVMGVTLLIIGGLLPALAWHSLGHSRAAWSFLISIIAVFALVTFFGAPKIRGLLGVGLWTALIVPGVMAVTVIALSMLRDEYSERV